MSIEFPFVAIFTSSQSFDNLCKQQAFLGAWRWIQEGASGAIISTMHGTSLHGFSILTALCGAWWVLYPCFSPHSAWRWPQSCDLPFAARDPRNLSKRRAHWGMAMRGGSYPWARTHSTVLWARSRCPDDIVRSPYHHVAAAYLSQIHSLFHCHMFHCIITDNVQGAKWLETYFKQSL